MTEPLFSDFRVRKAMNQLGAKPQYKDGSDTDDYRLALHMRNEVEKYILENYFVGNVVPVETQQRSSRLVDILGGLQEENVLANIVKPGYVQPAIMGDTFVPPVHPTYEIDEGGNLTGRRMVFENLSGGEHSWRSITENMIFPDQLAWRDKVERHPKQEGTFTILRELLDGSTYPASVRYLRRTHTPGPQP